MRVCKTFAELGNSQGSHRLVSQQYGATFLGTALGMAFSCAFASHGAVLADVWAGKVTPCLSGAFGSCAVCLHSFQAALEPC